MWLCWNRRRKMACKGSLKRQKTSVSLIWTGELKKQLLLFKNQNTQFPNIFSAFIHVWLYQSTNMLTAFLILLWSSEGPEDEAGRAAKGLGVGPARGDAEAEGHEAAEGERVPEAEAGELRTRLLLRARRRSPAPRFRTLRRHRRSHVHSHTRHLTIRASFFVEKKTSHGHSYHQRLYTVIGLVITKWNVCFGKSYALCQCAMSACAYLPVHCIGFSCPFW